MPFSFRDFLKGLRITPKTSSDADRQGELEVLSTDGKLRYHDGSSVSPVVTESSTATLTNKTIDGDTNTVQDLALTSLKTVLADANKVIQRDGAGAVISGAVIGGGGSGDVVTTDGTQTLTNKTIDGDNNTLQDISITSLKTDAGAPSTFISRDALGVVISTKAVPAGTVVGTSDTQTLTGKTIDGDDNTVQDLPLTAIKTVLGSANTFLSRDGSGIPISTKAVPTGAVVGTTDSQTLTNKTIDADANTISNIDNADIKSAAAIDRTKLASGTAYRLVANDASGVMSENAALTASRVLVSDANGQPVASTTTTTGLGNLVTGTASSVDGEIALFDSTTGKLIKRATGTGVVKATSGVYSTGTVSLTTEVSGTLPIGNGGTGQTTQTAAFDALSPTTTKGDIIVDNGTNAIRLAVGTDGHVLTADSAQASGVKWAAAGSGSVSFIGASLTTRVTAQPSATGQYRALIKNNAATTWSDDAPSVGPSSSNGMRIYTTDGTGPGTSGQTNKWEAYIGTGLIEGKDFVFLFWPSTGRNGDICTVYFNEGGNEIGLMTFYDPGTGIATVTNPLRTGGGTRGVGITPGTGTGGVSRVSDCYWDIGIIT